MWDPTKALDFGQNPDNSTNVAQSSASVWQLLWRERSLAACSFLVLGQLDGVASGHGLAPAHGNPASTQRMTEALRHQAKI